MALTNVSIKWHYSNQITSLTRKTNFQQIWNFFDFFKPVRNFWKFLEMKPKHLGIEFLMWQVQLVDSFEIRRIVVLVAAGNVAAAAANVIRRRHLCRWIQTIELFKIILNSGRSNLCRSNLCLSILSRWTHNFCWWQNVRSVRNDNHFIYNSFLKKTIFGVI